MREIKFRAWVKNEDLFGESMRKKYPNGHMFTGFSFGDVYAGHDEANCWADSEPWEEPNWETAILMQYTGLKDKNGKEIYEGDLLDGGHDEPTLVEWETRADNDCSHAGFNFGEDASQWEIIGNLYENPDLLTN